MVNSSIFKFKLNIVIILSPAFAEFYKRKGTFAFLMSTTLNSFFMTTLSLHKSAILNKGLGFGPISNLD